MDKDYYEILGLERGASDDDIKKAYRSLAMKHHPDKNQGDDTAEAKFKEINEAHDVLKDPVKKSNYDQFGDPNGRPGFQQHGFQSSDAQNINDIINDFFMSGGGPGGASFHHVRQRMKNPDVSTQIAITLEDAYKGISIPLEVALPSGTNTINVIVPPGARDGMVLRIKEKGLHQNTNLPPGDLHINVKIKPHHVFTPMGADLYTSQTISMIKAVLGCNIDITLLDDTRVNVKIPEGTQPNQKIRLKGKGMPGLNNPKIHGDLYINANVTVPTNLTQEQKETLEGLGIS